jgi:1-acyl-sn-glycerol-3-phosphate acyltransferase
MKKNNSHSNKSSNPFLEIFGRIWALWGILTFVTTFLIIFLPSMVAHLIPGKKGQDYFIWVSRIWMNIWLALVGCPVTIHGREKFIKGQTYIVVFNHNALLDVPLSAPYVPGGNKTIAKSSFTKVPIFGFFYARGAILVNRKDERSRRKSYEAMRKVLRDGIHMCLYPEGTRNRTQEPLKPFYDGAFKLAIDSGKSIIPCVLVGTKKAMPIHKTFYLIPTRLHMHFLDPVSVENKDTATLKKEVFDYMTEKFVNES